MELYLYFPSLPSSHLRCNFPSMQVTKMEGRIGVMGLIVNIRNTGFNTKLLNLVDSRKNVKQSHYRPGVAQRVPGS